MKKLLNDGITINYEESGKKDGFPILFLHGNGEDLHLFDNYREPLKDYHLILMDSRCCGLSSDGKLTYELMAEDAKELLLSLNILKADVIGFSDGGITGIILSRDTNLVRKLFALGPNLYPEGLTDEAIKGFKDEYEKNPSQLLALMVNEPHLDPASLKSINARTILITGENDIIRLDHMELIRDSIPNNYLYIIKNADHFTVTSAFEEVIKIIKNELTLTVYAEDNQIIVVEKPVGVLSQEDETKDPDILSITKNYLKIKYQKPGNVYLGLVQRLDRNVSGLMVFAKSSKAAKRLNEERPQKTYLACVYGSMATSEGHLVDYLLKDEKAMKAYKDKTGKEAILDYRVMAKCGDLSLLEVKIKTGRFHQIRFQLSNIGHSIFNDQKYNSSIKANGFEIGLDAYELSFIHPVSKETVVIKRYPNRYPFSLFDFNDVK